jgi:hypothetical protein
MPVRIDPVSTSIKPTTSGSWRLMKSVIRDNTRRLDRKYPAPGTGR